MTTKLPHYVMLALRGRWLWHADTPSRPEILETWDAMTPAEQRRVREAAELQRKADRAFERARLALSRAVFRRAR